MRPLVALVEVLEKPSFVPQSRDLIAVNAKASLERELGCKRFDVLVEPEEPRRFVPYEIYENEAAFDDHLASSFYPSVADAIENEIEERSDQAPCLLTEMATTMRSPREASWRAH